MQAWLVRGCVMAVVNATAQTILAELEVNHPTSMSVVRPVTLAILVGVSGLWGGLDGWLRTENRGMTWFYAGLFGGVLAGVLGVIGQAVFVDQTGVSALGSAVTTGAAFTALLIMVPAGLGLAVGGTLQPPTRRKDRGPDRPLDEDPPDDGGMLAEQHLFGDPRFSGRLAPAGPGPEPGVEHNGRRPGDQGRRSARSDPRR